MERTNVNSSGEASVSPTRVPFVGLVSPLNSYGVEIAEWLRSGARLYRRTVEALHRRQAINRTIRELSRLDDRTLADIGLHRSQIASVACASSEHGPIVK